MPGAPLHVPVRAARRLAVEAQRLAGSPPTRRRPPSAAQVLETAEALGCLQLDPTAAVARSHLLVLRARLGPVDPATVDTLAYEQRSLFDYWAHEASLVCAADAPLHRWAMDTWPWRDGPATRRATAWLEANASFRDHVLDRLRADGPLPVSEIEDRSVIAHRGGWTGEERSVARMVDVLWFRGEVGVARRDNGGRRLWDLAERSMPAAVQAVPELNAEEAVERAALRALRMLGVARAAHLRVHFTRTRYPGLLPALDRLHARGEIVAATLDGLGGDWWVHAADVEALARHAEAVRAGAPFRGRTVLLSPFDNLLCDRTRTELLFGFEHRLEIYTPRDKRRWGYFVLPILHRDALIGRADLVVDRREGVLRVLSLHAEPRPPSAGRAIRRDLERLAAWQGAERVAFPDEVPRAWRDGLLA